MVGENPNPVRPRRLRQNGLLRDMVSETQLSLDSFIQPYFLTEKVGAQEPITGFSEVYRWGIDALSRRIEADLDRGVRHFLLFGSAAHKDEVGSGAYAENGVVPMALRELRKRFSDSLLLYTDVCLCPFTNHGHCGLLSEDGRRVLNDESLEPLARMALVHAEAGADVVAPSDMMDGRVGYLRKKLDTNGKSDVAILAYTAKYASAYYGPFREALQSSPGKKVLLSDRTTYQMDFRNSVEALRELRLDLSEGADMVMVKPALAYLDIIQSFRKESAVPVVAYSVSGEYQMVKALVAAGMAEEEKLAIENLTAIRRAGAQVIITYYASVIAEKGWLR